jgi:hypothetical protein
MNIEIADELAMVLPLPIAHDSSESAVQFVDLSSYPTLFVDLAKAFPDIYSYPKSRGIARQARLQQPKLEVHDVGAFVASFVPSPRDFDRLDDRFRLSPAVFEKREEYTDYGFAVFQLKPKKRWLGLSIGRQTIHPMAFTFPTRKPSLLFFPTLHVHDGNDVPEHAPFDHSLYFQSDKPLYFQSDKPLVSAFEKSAASIEKHVDVARSKDLIAKAPAYRRVIEGEQANGDTWIATPADS